MTTTITPAGPLGLDTVLESSSPDPLTAAAVATTTSLLSSLFMSTTATTPLPSINTSVTSQTSPTSTSTTPTSSPPKSLLIATKSTTTTLGYTHAAPSPILSRLLRGAFPSPSSSFPTIPTTGPHQRPSHILAADYEGAYLLALSPNIVFKFAPSYRILTAAEAAADGTTLTWVLGEAPVSPLSAETDVAEGGGSVAGETLLERTRRREEARYAAIERRVKRDVEYEGRMLDLLMGSGGGSESDGASANGSESRKDECLWIIQPHLAVPSGLLLARMRESVQSVIDRARSSPSSATSTPIITGALALRWSRQIAQALAWLEQRNHYHGDLKPSNVLLDAHNNAILSDFGSAGHIGTYLRTSSNLYTTGWGKGGVESEAYAFGWTVYDIFHGGHDEALDEPDAEVVYPDVTSMGAMENVVQRCWRREWKSVAELREAVEAVYEAAQTPADRAADDRDEIRAREARTAERSQELREEMRRVYEGFEIVDETDGQEGVMEVRGRSDSGIGMMECGYDSD